MDDSQYRRSAVPAFSKGRPPSPSAPVESMLALVPQTMVGGDTASGMAAISRPAPEGGAVVSLSSSRPEMVSVPKSVTIPARATSARFPIVTHPVNEDGVTVQISMASGELRRGNTMVVYSCMQPLTLSAGKVTGGTAVTGTIALHQPAPAGGLAVKVSSDKPSLASVPAEVKVPAGSASAAFQIATRATRAEAAAVITVSIGGCARTAGLTLMP